MFFIKHYWRAVHYTLRATVLVKNSSFWPAPDGPLKCSPSVRSELKERLNSAQWREIDRKPFNAPMVVQVLISTGKSVRIGSLQTSKNWESLEVVIIEN